MWEGLYAPTVCVACISSRRKVAPTTMPNKKARLVAGLGKINRQPAYCFTSGGGAWSLLASGVTTVRLGLMSASTFFATQRSWPRNIDW